MRAQLLEKVSLNYTHFREHCTKSENPSITAPSKDPFIGIFVDYSVLRNYVSQRFVFFESSLKYLTTPRCLSAMDIQKKKKKKKKKK